MALYVLGVQLGVPEVLLALASSSGTPAYRQIVDQVRLHIDRGTLAPGTPLPSVRSLAAQLGIHFNTVAEAYRTLADEGWIDLTHGKRATVRALNSTPSQNPSEAESLRQRLRHLLAEMRLKGISTTAIEHDVQAMLHR